MATGSQNMTTYNARTVTGSNSAASPAGALLLSGAGRADDATGDTWIFLDSAGGTSTPWGIKHDQANNKIQIFGAGTNSVWTEMDTGNTYIGGSLNTGSTLTVRAQDNTHEGGEIILSPATDSFSTVHIDAYDSLFRLHDGTNERFKVDISTGNATINGNLGIGADYAVLGGSYKLYVNGTSYLNGELSVIGTILEKNGSICIDNTTTDLTASNNGSSSTIYHSIWGRDKSNRSWFCVEGYTNANGSVAAFLGVRNYNTDGTAQSWKGITITEAKDNTLTYTVSDPAKFITAIMGDSDSSKFYRGDKTWSNTISNEFNIVRTTTNWKTGATLTFNTTMSSTTGYSYIAAYQTPTATSDNQSLVIAATGSCFIGGGEGAETIHQSIMSGSGTEDLYLCPDGSIQIYTGADSKTHRATIDSTPNFYPATNNVGNIGTSSREWSSTYSRAVYARHYDASKNYTGDRNMYYGYNHGGNHYFYNTNNGSNRTGLLSLFTEGTNFLDRFAYRYAYIAARNNSYVNADYWWKIANLTDYFNFNIYINGGWNSGSPSVAVVNVCNRNGKVQITQLSGFAGDHTKTVRLAQNSTDNWDLLVRTSNTNANTNHAAQTYDIVGTGGITVYQNITSPCTTSYGTTKDLNIQSCDGTSITSGNYSTWCAAASHTHSQYLTSHQSLSNYVTLDGDQTITGTKTFHKRIIAYAYKQSSSLPFITFDKPGSNATGIGPDGTSNRIKFGPCDLAGTAWVAQSSFNSNQWFFQGSIYGTSTLTIESSATIAGGITSQHGHIFNVAGNEFNWIPDGYNSAMWFNYESFGRTNNSTVSEYICGNGRHGYANLNAAKVYNAVWNDFAEYRESNETEGGRVLISDGKGHLIRSTERLQPAARVISDTFGCSVGSSDTAHTPIGVAGRVLVYPYQPRENYKVGDALCAAPNGTADIMTREEIIQYPDRIIGIVDEIPNYEVWNQVLTSAKPGDEGGKTETHTEVKGRIWIYVR